MSLASVTLTLIVWSAVLVPSLAVTVALYNFLVSKSGADTKVKTPAVVIASSEPETVKVTESPSASVAVTVSIAVWFSAALKVADEVKTGTSLTSVIFTVISWDVELVSSLAVTVAV